MSAKRIGILTGGGDVPGLNSVIKTVVYRGSEIGCEVIGIRAAGKVSPTSTWKTRPAARVTCCR
jgi:hypothetical protein